MQFLGEVLGGGAFWLSRSLPVLVIKPDFFLGLAFGIVSAFAVPCCCSVVFVWFVTVSIVSRTPIAILFVHRSISRFALQSSRSAPLFITISLPCLLLDAQLAMMYCLFSLLWFPVSSNFCLFNPGNPFTYQNY